MNTTNSADRLLMLTAAEAQVFDLAGRADQLLAKIDSANAIMAESLRIEATRLFGVCFDITRLLSLGDIAGAYRLSAGGADENGDVLGVAI